MYIRTSSRTNKDGSKVTYVQLAHNYWDKQAGCSKTKIIHSFGREDELDREALERLVVSIRRYLNPDQPLFKEKETDDCSFLGVKDYGGTYVLEQLWQRLGLDTIIKRLLKDRSYEKDVERLLFTMVANRALDPSSKLAIEEWAKEDVYIPEAEDISVHNLYRTMDFLLEHKEELEKEVYISIAHLLNLEVDLLFFDTTSTYFEVQPPEAPEEDEFRMLGYSKDKRPDLLQMVIGLAVTRDGIPIKSWVWPGNTPDMSVIKEVKDDLTGWKLGRIISVVDAGFSSEDNLRYLQRAGGHYIAAEKLRSDKSEVKEALSKRGRFKEFGNLKLKEITVNEGEARKRYVLAQNPKEAERQKIQREEIIKETQKRLKEIKQLPNKEHTKAICELRSHAVYGKYLRQLKDGRLKLDKTKIREEAKYDGKFLIRTSDDSLSAEDVVHGYKQLVQIESSFRSIKHTLKIRPVYHRLEDRIRSHVLLVWLALLLVRISENNTEMSWNKIRRELSRIKVGDFIFNSGRVFQTSQITKKQSEILSGLKIEHPPRYPKIESKP